MMNQSSRLVLSTMLIMGLTTVLNFSTANAGGGDYGPSNGAGKLAIPDQNFTSEFGIEDGSDMFHKILRKFEYGSSPLNGKMLIPSTLNYGIVYYYQKSEDGGVILKSTSATYNWGTHFSIGVIDLDFAGYQVLYFPITSYANPQFNNPQLQLDAVRSELQTRVFTPTITETGDWSFNGVILRQTNDKHKFIEIVKASPSGKCGSSETVPVEGICSVSYYYKKVSLETNK